MCIRDRDLVEQVLETAAHEDVMVYMMSGGQALANASQVADTSHYHMGVYQEMMDRVVNKTDDIGKDIPEFLQLADTAAGG